MTNRFQITEKEIRNFISIRMHFFIRLLEIVIQMADKGIQFYRNSNCYLFVRLAHRLFGADCI